MSQALDSVRAYHERTKHHFRRYADGPGGLDWATQPDPFRTYAGSPQTLLPLLAEASPIRQLRYAELYTGAIAPQPLTLVHIGALLELAFGLSAWKQYGASRWALRCNPSSGNLHPTEAYVAVQGVAGLADGVHHYLSRDHLLEQRCAFAAPALPAGGFLVGLSAIHWREAWKYGERAFRYCQHDAGHALAAARYAAAVLGWRARLLDDWADADIAALLGLDRDEDFGAAEREHPDLLLWIETNASDRRPEIDVRPLRAAAGQWTGRANRLSPEHKHDWPVIEAVAAASRKPRTQAAVGSPPRLPALLPLDCTAGAVALIKQRRSAQAFDGVTSISAQSFYRMLDATLPRAQVPPWDAVAWPPRIHLALFVHRVEGLLPGLYFLLRHDGIEARMRAELSGEFQWQGVEGCPPHLRLYRVLAADTRNAARALSCHQDIAADSAFSLGMLAEYDSALNQGPWVYRQLFWEAGMLGQVLYLEAEAAGVRGTGIGCFFDDGVHDLLGIQGHWLQSLYHFTVGGALSDERLQTLPPYAHLQRS
ncbi:SagB-type dehydrogenase family enzyme [Sulfuritortus calidifontis]|uniref:SagB-type dehydrogenase family enzyme n=1 Tax=Sulfuritortus calidifontis TaxID=1914471 RepID=A0A4R3JSZ9_9PROT|nr:nitroreductase family protein [Sulfuritortus calidifontis]TCS69001.1 SagB-type dehydrogenase family enzyme [Sulfuritortus calidifontis]